jgi:hypothetical protein
MCENSYYCSQSLESIQTQLSRYTPTLDILLERSRQSWNKDPPPIPASRPESLRFSFISHMSRFSTTALYINQDHDRQSITAFDFDYEVVNSRIYKHAMADEGRRASIAAFRASVADSLHAPEEHGEDNLESVREEGTDPHTHGVIEAWDTWDTPNPPTMLAWSPFDRVFGFTEVQEEAIFENIFLALTRAYDSALQAIPIARRQFMRYLKAAEENQAPKEVKTLWSNLIWRCKICLEVSEALQARLVNMRLKDPVISAAGVLNGRNDSAFWVLCKNFMCSFIGLVSEMKKAKDLRLLAQDIIIVLRPVHKACREAGRLVETSPWKYLADADVYAQVVHGINGQYLPQYSQTKPQLIGNTDNLESRPEAPKHVRSASEGRVYGRQPGIANFSRPGRSIESPPTSPSTTSPPVTSPFPLVAKVTFRERIRRNS